MIYKVTLYNKWREPYFLVDTCKDAKKPACRHINYDCYEVNDLETCKAVLKDFLDAPLAEMTLEQVKKEFEDPKVGAIDEKRLLAIRDYYNGRLELQRKIFKEIEKAHYGTYVYRFDIPFRCNYFACYADDGDEDLHKQEDAYIQVEATESENVKI